MQSLFLPVAVIVLDQITKGLVEKAVQNGVSIPVLGGLIHISRVHNPGSSFGVLKTPTVPIAVTCLAVIAWVIVVLTGTDKRLGRTFQLGAGLIVGGALGNLIDRVRLGSVIDFIDFHIWPVFNVADTAVCVGAAILVYNLVTGNPGGRNN